MGVGTTSAPRGVVHALWRSAAVLMSLATLFWSSNFLVGRAIHEDVSPVALSFWRWSLAFLVILGFAARHLRQDVKALARAWPLLLVLAAVGVAVFNTLIYLGLSATSVVNGVLLQSTMPLLILLGSFLLFGERVRPLQLAAVVVSLSGVAVVASQGSWQALRQLEMGRGDAFIFLAVCCYALYSVLLRRRPAVHPLSLLATTFGLGALMLLPFYLREQVVGPGFEPTPIVLGAIAYVAVLPSVVSFLFFNRSVELVGANRTGQFLHLTPVYGSVLAVALLGETIQAYHLMGGALIGAGILVAARTPNAGLAAAA